MILAQFLPELVWGSLKGLYTTDNTIMCSNYSVILLLYIVSIYGTLQLCKNFHTSYRRIEGIRYTVYPNEWVCTLKELSQ